MQEMNHALAAKGYELDSHPIQGAWSAAYRRPGSDAAAEGYSTGRSPLDAAEAMFGKFLREQQAAAA